LGGSILSLGSEGIGCGKFWFGREGRLISISATHTAEN